jgi:hypothetical protein
METVSKPIVESVFDYVHAANGNIEEYHDMSIAKRFSQKEGIDLVEVFASVFKGFEVHGRDTHEFRLKMVLYRLMHAPQIWHFKIDQLYSSWDFPSLV